MCLYAEQKLVAERNNNPLYMWKVIVVKAKTENKEEHKYFSPYCWAEWKLPSSMYMENTVLYSYDKYPLASCEAVITNGNDLVDADFVITAYTNRKLLANGFFHGYSSLECACRRSKSDISILDKDFIIIVRYVCIGLSAIGNFITSNDSVVSSSILYDGIDGFIPAHPCIITKAMKQYGKNLNEIYA